MNKEELIERYIGAYPDERFQKGRKTWEELRNSMHADLDLFVSKLQEENAQLLLLRTEAYHEVEKRKDENDDLTKTVDHYIEIEDSLRSEIESLKGKLKEAERPYEFISMNDQPYPLIDVLGKLIEATEILLHKKDYDGGGYEEMNQCVVYGKIIVERIKVVQK